MAALLTIWSMQTQVNDQLMNSMIGRSPAIAAPTPRPEKPASLIGVSMMRLGPNLFEHPFGHLVRAVVLGDLLAHQEDVLVALHLLGHGGAEGFSELHVWHSCNLG